MILVAKPTCADTKCSKCKGSIFTKSVAIYCNVPDLSKETIPHVWHPHCAWQVVECLPCLVPDVDHAYKHFRRVASNPLLALTIQWDKYFKNPRMQRPSVSLRMYNISQKSRESLRKSFVAAQKTFKTACLSTDGSYVSTLGRGCTS